MSRYRKCLEELALQTARIKELENLLCPAEQHDYILIDSIPSYGNNGDVSYKERYVCKKCLKEKFQYK